MPKGVGEWATKKWKKLKKVTGGDYDEHIVQIAVVLLGVKAWYVQRGISVQSSIFTPPRSKWFGKTWLFAFSNLISSYAEAVIEIRVCFTNSILSMCFIPESWLFAVSTYLRHQFHRGNLGKAVRASILRYSQSYFYHQTHQYIGRWVRWGRVSSMLILKNTRKTWMKNTIIADSLTHYYRDPSESCIIIHAAPFSGKSALCVTKCYTDGIHEISIIYIPYGYTIACLSWVLHLVVLS